MSKISPKVKKLYYSIGEVSEMTDLKSYVLRYWETEFSQLKPPKNRAGNRTYRQKDIEVILNIKDLLYKKKFTIDGARVVLQGKDKITSEVKDSNSISNNQKVILGSIKKNLEEKKVAYSSDVIYATNNELGFDYLRDNMALRISDKVQCSLDFAVIDEVDSILICLLYTSPSPRD